MRTLVMLLGGLTTLWLLARPADAATYRVPHDYGTIQAAVDAADAGDTIRVGPGEHCGATIDKEVHLVGGVFTSIVGCAAPVLFGDLRVGFFLPDERASGTTIKLFHFDGEGVSDDDLEPLAFAVFGREAHGVVVIGNRVTGTVQAITNTGGDGWLVLANLIRELTLFECPGPCGGGVGIVMQKRIPLGDPEPTAWGNVVLGNSVSGAIPEGHDEFGMTGILLLGQDRVVVSGNRLRIRTNPGLALAPSVGIEVASSCCGLPAELEPVTRAIILGNDGRDSELALVVEEGNAEGGFIAGNRGVNVIEGVTVVVP